MRRIGNRGKSPNILASILTFAVISALIIAGPTSAWQVILQEFSNKEPIQGEGTSAKFNLKLQQEIHLGFESIIVYLDGQESATCYFDIHGNPKTTPGNGSEPGNPKGNLSWSNASDVNPINMSKIKSHGNSTYSDICGNMSIQQITLEDYGYGYGYGYGYKSFTYEGNETSLMISGNMPYMLKINTAPLDLGDYKVKVTLTLNGKIKEQFNSETRSFTVIDGIRDDDDPWGGGRENRSEDNNTKIPVPLAAPAIEIPENNTEIPLPEPTRPGFFSRITGAVIGTLGTTGTAIIGIVIIALIAGVAGLQIRKRFFAPGITTTA